MVIFSVWNLHGSSIRFGGRERRSGGGWTRFALWWAAGASYAFCAKPRGFQSGTPSTSPPDVCYNVSTLVIKFKNLQELWKVVFFFVLSMVTIETRQAILLLVTRGRSRFYFFMRRVLPKSKAFISIRTSEKKAKVSFTAHCCYCLMNFSTYSKFL